MCLAMYLFTNDELDQSDWDESDPKVFVQTVSATPDNATKKWPHDQTQAYYMGSYQGCGCGWSPVSQWDDEPDKEAKKRDRKDLVELLKEVNLRTSWLIVCWEGEQGEAIKDSKSISLGDVLNPEFEFEELRQYRITDSD